MRTFECCGTPDFRFSQPTLLRLGESYGYGFGHGRNRQAGLSGRPDSEALPLFSRDSSFSNDFCEEVDRDIAFVRIRDAKLEASATHVGVARSRLGPLEAKLPEGANEITPTDWSEAR